MVDFDYVMRIFNNIMSYIEKYADRAAAVDYSIEAQKGFLIIKIENKVAELVRPIKGNRMGTENIRRFMLQMYGRCDTEVIGNRYLMTLMFKAE